ncbi:MBL fold metallo-hydrolase [Natrarchaeobius halalkaliphilus]|uniref:MBL fold metallo-hydrolase n=1 Tax=Natrarchaeobius halalkaliphilus TaxID=1679091 RepID=A0A3N6LK40_9EURY|nr:MBL fold metallo-hydrolase [Natrarchaeobius halalkaliphilus]RQG88938.1 MBL fold metallo-hydrolase [Natrarchaeobius halalkaliphilus]
MDVVRRPVSAPTRAPEGETNAYVLGTDPAILVDPANRSDELDRLVRDREIAHVLVTHAHPDHVGAVEAYARETGAAVWARGGRTDRFREATGRRPDRRFSSGTTITLGESSVRVLETPGHASDHVALEVGRNGPILCGDCAVRDGSVVVGAPDGDMRAYVSTLRRLWAIDPPALYPGHGPVIERPRATLERHLSHRHDRERRIEAAVDDGATTLEGILEGAYEKELAGVRDLARATVIAHLEKLVVEDRLEWDGERAGPVRD